MKRVAVATMVFIIFGACSSSSTNTEIDYTSQEVCVWDRTYDFWGGLEKETLIVCGPKIEKKE